MKLLAYQTHQKIYYPAGSISLIMLPILCLLWLQQHKAFVQYRAMDVAFWSPEWNNSLPVQQRSEFPPKREYVQIDLEGNDRDDLTSLEFARIKLRRFRQAQAYTQGVQFNFGTKSKYWSFIKALDILKEENIEIYAPYENHIYALFRKPKPNEKILDFGCLLCNDVIYGPPSAEELSEKRLADRIAFAKLLFNDYRLPIAAFVALLILTIIKFQRVHSFR